VKRRCDICGRKFRYPGFSFDPTSPSLSGHVTWAHDSLVLDRLPYHERDLAEYVAVYKECLAVGEGYVADRMLAKAASDERLRAMMTGEQPLSRKVKFFEQGPREASTPTSVDLSHVRGARKKSRLPPRSAASVDTSSSQTRGFPTRQP
jgi:hypothetical protein